MTLKRRAVRGALWSATQLWGQQAISFGLFILLARLLVPNDFGLVALAFTFIGFIQVFLDQGFGSAIIQLDTMDEVHLSTAFWSNLVFGAVMMVATALCAGPIAELFNNHALAPILAGLSPIFVIRSASTVQEALLKRELEFRPLALRTLIGTISGGIIGVGMAVAAFGVWSLVAMQLGSGIIAGVILWKMSSFRPTLRFSKAAFLRLFSFGKHVIGSGLMNFVNRNADDLLIGYFLGTTALGYYTIAYRIIRVSVGLLTGVTNSVAFPLFSRLRNRSEDIRQGFYFSIQVTAALAFPVLAGIGLVAPEFVRLFYGTGWDISIPVMQVLSLIGILEVVQYFNTSVLLAAGKPSWNFAIAAVNACCNVVAFAIGIRWGIVGVATAYVIRGYVLSPVALAAVKRLIAIQYTSYLRLLSGPVIGCVVMALSVVLGKHFLRVGNVHDAYTLIVTFLLGVASYNLALRISNPSLLHRMCALLGELLPAKADASRM